MNLVNRKRIYEFLLVINSNFGPILHRFWDTATYWLKIAHFSYPSLIRRPRSLSSRWNFRVPFGVRKLESWGYSVVKVAWSLLQPSLTDPPVWETDGRAMAYSALWHMCCRALKMSALLYNNITKRLLTTVTYVKLEHCKFSSTH